MVKSKIIKIAAVSLVGGLAVAGCSGSGNTDGGGQDFNGTQYVADDSAGTLSLDLVSSEIAVGSVAGFRATARDGSGAPIQAIRITCDTEEGLAIVEPTSGSEITDSNGSISGLVGCGAPGSLQLGCRVANKRQFRTVKCTGDVPSGFAGFAGAAGGGLGGGVQTVDDGGPGGSDPETGVRITKVEILDGGADAADVNVIDISLSACVPVTTKEPFSDAKIKIAIQNNFNSSVELLGYSYTIVDVNGGTADFESDRLSFIGVGEAKQVGPGGDAVSVESFFANARSSGDKVFYGSSTAIDPSTGVGFRNVKIKVFARTDAGDDFTISASTSISLGSINRCE